MVYVGSCRISTINSVNHCPDNQATDLEVQGSHNQSISVGSQVMFGLVVSTVPGLVSTTLDLQVEAFVDVMRLMGAIRL